MARFVIGFFLSVVLMLTATTASAAPVAIAAVMAMAETAVAYAAGTILASAIISSFCTYFLTSLALTAASALLNKVSGGNAMNNAANRSQTIRSPNANRTIVYGRCMVSGPLVYASTTSANNHLNLVVAIAGHEIDAIEEIWFDGWKLSLDAGGNITGAADINGNTTDKMNGKGLVRQYLGTTTQAADATLMAEDTNWKSTAQLKGIAYLYVRLTYDINAWSGVPNIKALVRGKKLYDPRTGNTAWSQNWALCVRDYIASPLGLGCTTAEIDDSTVIAAANTSDEAVVLDAAGHTQPRYQLNGTVDLGAKIIDNLNNMITAGAGSVVYQQGQWKVLAGAYSAPVHSLTDDDLRDKISIQARTSRKDLYNYITGQFLDPAQAWQPNSFPPVTSAQYQTDDGGTIQQDINLPYTTDGYAAQRLAMLFLNKTRHAGTVLFPAKLSAFKVGIWERINISVARLGWVNKVFIVIDWKFTGTGVDLVLQEDSADCYNWNYGQAAMLNYASGTTLKLPGVVAPPTGLALASGTDVLELMGDGTVISRIHATWTGPADSFVTVGGKIEVQYKKSTATAWLSAPTAAGGDTDAYISPVMDGVNYDVRVRARDSLGAVSGWATVTNYQVIGKNAPPSDVTGFSVAMQSNRVVFAWSAVTDPDLKQYEIRQGATWATAAPVYDGKTSSYNAGLLAAGSYTYWAAAVDQNGNYSANPVSLAVTVSAPSVSNLSATLAGTDVVLGWTGAPGSFAIAGYEIRYGASFTGGTLQAQISGNTLKTPANWTGNRQFWIAPYDGFGNYGAAAAVSFSVAAPSLGNLAATISGGQVALSWTGTPGSLVIDNYEIRTGDAWGTGTPLAKIKSNTLTIPANWTGGQTFWAAAVDVDGNYSTPVSLVVTVNAPSAVSLSANVSGTDLTLAWTSATGSLSIDQYEIRYGATWTAGALQTRIKGNSLKLPVTGSQTYWIAAIDIAGNYGTPSSVAVTVNAPGAPAPVMTFSGNQAALTWGAVTGTLPVDHYEIRTGATWAAGTVVTTLKGTTYSQAANWLGAKTYWVAAVDSLGGYSPAGSVTATINAPGAVTVTQQVIDNYILLKWTAANGTLPIDHYQVLKGATLAGAVSVGNINGLFTALFESASGNYTYWIIPVDTAGNQGTASSLTAYVNAPPDYVLYYNLDSLFQGYGAVNSMSGATVPTDATVSGNVINKTGSTNVYSTAVCTNGYSSGKHFWEITFNKVTTGNDGEVGVIGNTTANTSQIGNNASGYGYNGYLGKKGNNSTFTTYGATFTTGDVLGVALDMDAGTLTFYKNGESQGQAYTGLAGTFYPAVSLRYAGDQAAFNFGASPFAFQCPEGFNGRASFAGLPDGSIFGPVNLAESFQSHFTSHSYTSPNDQVNAGYPLYEEPSGGTAVYTETIDYGTTLAASLVTGSLTYTSLAGNPTITPKISYKLNAGDAWTDFNGVWSAYCTNFRYIKIAVTVTGGGADLIKITGLNIRLNVKLKNDAGSGTANAADANGTPVSFNVSFVDVSAINVTASGTVPVTPVYQFTDAPNPTTFYVYLFDKNGNRVSGNFSWSAKGV